MPELTFFLNNTTAEEFERWLRDYTQRTSIQQNWNLDEDTKVVTRNEWGFNPSERVSTLSSAVVLVIPGWRKTTDTGTTPITLAKFSLLKLGDRLQIQMGYWANPGVSSFFAGLLSEVEISWPETSQIIASHINPDKQAEEEQEPAQEQGKPWQVIPDYRWDRYAVRSWCYGWPNSRIAKGIPNITNPRTVTNRIIHLRKQYPEAKIPTDAERINLMTSDDT